MYTAKGFVDSDFFGIAVAPHNSSRRTSRVRPIRVNLGRPRKLRSSGAVGESVDIYLIGEPCDIQARRGSFDMQDQGRVVKRFFNGYFDSACELHAGDHVFGNETFLVTFIARKGDGIRADLERLIRS